jgi:ribonuclease HI
MVPEISAAQSLAILSSFPQSIGRLQERQIQEEEIDKTRPWGYFDGASQNNRCGGGGILYLSDSHHFSMTFGLGMGTNNFAELMSLKLLIAFAIEKGCHSLTVYGDSMNVINWIKSTQRCTITRLVNILEDIKTLQTSFDTFTCRHVYRERNKEADRRSKEGVQLAMGQWKVTEMQNGHQTGIFTPTFYGMITKTKKLDSHSALIQMLRRICTLYFLCDISSYMYFDIVIQQFYG